VPPAHPQRHHDRCAARWPRAHRRDVGRRLQPRHHARQSTDPRHRRWRRREIVETIQDLGLCSRGSGADNIRNVTGTPTAGIDPQELLDTRSYAREWHFHILNDRSLTGLPRKFNVAFDGAGRVAALEETNDIGFQAVEVVDDASVPAGIYFRLVLGGITGHKDIARSTGVVLKPEQATRVADAIVRVFIANGDRTNRNKARLKSVLDAWGFEKFLGAVEEQLGTKLSRVEPACLKPRPDADRAAHLGVQPQKQPGLNWIGLVLPVGKLTTAQMRAIAALARELGDGDIRLTVWQTCSSPASDESPEAVRALRQWAFRQADRHPRRPRRLHREHRLQVLRGRHQGHR
jgi:ferredoxin-nitrite reductase